MELVEAKPLVDGWASAWPGGTSSAVASALDVLVGDALEAERGMRPAGPLVVYEAAFHGAPRVAAGEIGHWMLGWPARPGLLERTLHGAERALVRRLEGEVEAGEPRVAAFRAAVEGLGEVPWTSIADMEAMSLALGHLGPSRQPAVLPVIHTWLVAVAAAYAGTAYERMSVTEAATPVLLKVEQAMATVAALSNRAIEELARRARAKGHALPDPFALRLPDYLPLLGGTLR